jgi:hypothetical protein
MGAGLIIKNFGDLGCGQPVGNSVGGKVRRFWERLLLHTDPVCYSVMSAFTRWSRKSTEMSLVNSRARFRASRFLQTFYKSVRSESPKFGVGPGASLQ